MTSFVHYLPSMYSTKLIAIFGIEEENPLGMTVLPLSSYTSISVSYSATHPCCGLDSWFGDVIKTPRKSSVYLNEMKLSRDVSGVTVHD